MRIGHFVVASSVVVFVTVSLSCSSRKANTEIENSIVDIGIDKSAQKIFFDAKFLEGVWWIDTNSLSALFFITRDSLYYTEQQDIPYAITIKSDTLELRRENFTSFFKLKKLTKDSLTFYDFSINEDIKLFKKINN